MATLKHRLRMKNSAGGYDIIHLETSADLVLMTDGTTKLSDKISTMDTTIAGKLATTGTAAAATKLATARTVRTNLASTATASFDGSANITPGVTGILPVANGGTGVNNLYALKTALGVGNADYSDIITGSIGLGTVVTMASAQWIIVHFDTTNHIFYMMTVDVVSKSEKFGPNAQYEYSTLASVAKTYEDNLPTAVKNRLATLNVNGVTGKVIVPSYEQVNGGFSYMDSNLKRMAKYNGAAMHYWTSSMVGGTSVWFVSTDGALNRNPPSGSCGFRPCVALTM